MARDTNTGLLLEGNMEHRTKQAVIWLRGYDHDPGTLEAQVAALQDHGCRQTLLKNELFYEGYVDRVDVCFTDDPGITRDYETDGIKVVQLRKLTDEEIKAKQPKNVVQHKSADIENEQLKEQIAMLTKMLVANTPAPVEQKEATETSEDQTNKTLSIGSKSGTGKTAKNEH